MKIRIICCIITFIYITVTAVQTYAYTPVRTYTYDIHGNAVPLTQAYDVKMVLTGSDFDIGHFSDIRGLHVSSDKHVYICDSGNNRIIVLDENLSLAKVLGGFDRDGDEDRFNYPTDVYVDVRGDIYIADMRNSRIIQLDSSYGFVNEIKDVTSDLLPTDYTFSPFKIVIDNTGRIYTVARGVTHGIMEIDREGNIYRFLGAARVSFNPTEYIYRLFMSQQQRRQTTRIIPTEYNNLFIDENNFIYGTINIINPVELRGIIENSKYIVAGKSVRPTGFADMLQRLTNFLSLGFSQSGQGAVIKKLNLKGDDILLREGYHIQAGDLEYDKEPSSFVDIYVNDIGVYSVLDRQNGRIFTYDQSGVLLFAFGGKGNSDGMFSNPTAIDGLDDILIVADSFKNTLTVFQHTEFTGSIFSGIKTYMVGDYKESKIHWENTVRLSSNFDIGYIGIGRALLREDEYREAMRYFRIGEYREGYARAFYLLRRTILQKNFPYILLGIIIFILLRKMHSNRKKGKPSHDSKLQREV